MPSLIEIQRSAYPDINSPISNEIKKLSPINIVTDYNIPILGYSQSVSKDVSKTSNTDFIHQVPSEYYTDVSPSIITPISPSKQSPTISDLSPETVTESTINPNVAGYSPQPYQFSQLISPIMSPRISPNMPVVSPIMSPTMARTIPVSPTQIIRPLATQ